MSRKAPPAKKRHTKPCKFFQVDRCPHPADVCNFAHVIASSSDTESSIYCYYPGYYPQYPLSRHSYGPKVPLLKPLVIPIFNADSLRVDTKNSRKLPIPEFPSIHSRPSPPSLKIAAESSLPTSFTSCHESITTGSTSSELDEAVVTDDPQYREHSHSPQSQVRIEDDSPLIHVPPFSPFHQLTFNGPHTPPYDYDSSYMSGKLSDVFKSRNSTKSSMKQKNLKFKTKPCKFFPTERGCPKGSSCTFIHDESRHQSPSPVEELNPKEDNSRKNYFPVPWRVIGGGVRVGIKTEDLDPCSTATSSSSVDPPPKLDSDASHPQVISRKRSNSNPPTPSPHCLQFKMEHLFSAESPGVL